MRRRVALKLIKPGMDSKAVVARFTAERQALARMDHPNVAHIHDAGTTESGRLFFVMELIQGIRITTYCFENQLETRERIELVIKVCQAVQHAHQKGIIHRDLKPSNILVAVQDGIPSPKVIDFGIAKATEGRLTELTLQTELHHFLGTPAYMSPEQAEQREMDVDTRTDIYSLGVLLYELLTGETPFDTCLLLSGGVDELRRTIREVEPQRPSSRLSGTFHLGKDAGVHGVGRAQLKSEVSGDLDWIVMKCLEKDRRRRYETANALAMDLQRHLDHEPVLAGPPGRLYKIRKFAQRNHIVVASGITITLALLAGISISTSQAIRARHAEDMQSRLLGEAQQSRALAESAEAEARTREADSRRLLYIANMNLAQQLWETGDMPRLRQVLGETRRDPHRSFEWYFLMRMAHLDSKTIRSHPELTASTAISSDGKWGAMGTRSGTIELYNLATGEPTPTLRRRDKSIMALAFSPDQRQLLSLDEGRLATLWDMKRHSVAVQTFTLKSPRVGAFSPKGDRILVGEADGVVEMLDAQDGKRICELKGHTDWVFGIAFSPEGRQVATASWDRTVRLWDALTGEWQSSLPKHDAGLLAVAYSPDGRSLASGGFDSTIRLWDLTSGTPGPVLRGHTDHIRAIRFLANGQWLASGGADRTLRIWETSTGAPLKIMRGHSGEIDTLLNLKSHEADLGSGSHDGTLKLWNLSEATEVSVFGKAVTESGYADWLTSLAISRNGKRVAICRQSLPPEVWDTTEERRITLFTGHEPAYVSSLAFSPDGESVLTGGHDKTARVWEATTGRELLVLRGHQHFVSSVAWSSDGAYLATGSLDNGARIWNAINGNKLVTLEGHTGAVHAVKISTSSRWVATASEDKTVRIWNRVSGDEVRTLYGTNAWFLSVALSPDETRVIAGASDGTARIWDLRTGVEVLRVTTPFPAVSAVDFSPDGTRFLTTGEGRTAQLHDTHTGRQILVLRGDRSLISQAHFFHDGLRIGAVSRDGSFRTWRGVSAEQSDTWRRAESPPLPSDASPPF